MTAVRVALPVLAAVVLAACASTYNSGIAEKGPNTFFLQVKTPNSKGGGDESARQARTQAKEYCAKSGKEMTINSEDVGPVTADLFFSCK